MIKNLSEAKVFRAHSYFTLYRLFNNIYIKTEPTNPETAFDRPSEISSKEDIFNLIRQDLQYASDNLPYKTDEFGRWNKGAVDHLRAKLEMWDENYSLAADIVEVKANISALSVNTTNGETGNEFLVRHLNNCSLPTAIKDIKVSENNISIYPNPVFDQFTIEGASTPYQLEIVDLNGQILQTANIIENSGFVDVSELPNGMYIIKVKDLSTNEWKVKRIIKL